MARTPLTIRPARADDAASLSELAFRSKAHWGYSSEFMEACRAELTITPQSPGKAAVAEFDGRLAGFYALGPYDERCVELADLFVEPGYIGSGVGRALLDHAKAAARESGHTAMRIEADPHAEPFYCHAGAQRIGVAPSGSIPGRSLPLLELVL